MFTETLISLVKLSLCTFSEFVDSYQCLYHQQKFDILDALFYKINVCTYMPLVDLDNYLSNTIIFRNFPHSIPQGRWIRHYMYHIIIYSEISVYTMSKLGYLG